MNEPQKLLAAQADAMEAFRDAVLEQRGALSESGMTGDQINAVLAEFDPCFNPSALRLAAQQPQGEGGFDAWYAKVKTCFTEYVCKKLDYANMLQAGDLSPSGYAERLQGLYTREREITTLLAACPLAAPHSHPGDWQLVPREATDHMRGKLFATFTGFISNRTPLTGDQMTDALNLVWRDLLAAAPKAPAAGKKWRHKKRGTTYTEIGRGKLQSTGHMDMRDCVIYQGEDGAFWIRPTDEFEDGRFEPLPRAPKD